jgi:hypothetical protein
MFARARDDQRIRTYDAERARAVPVVLPARKSSYEGTLRSTPASTSRMSGTQSSTMTAGDEDKSLESWREEISVQNERFVASMTDEEREEQRREILQRFGPDIGDVLRRVKEQRLNQLQTPRKRQIDGMLIQSRFS